MQTLAIRNPRTGVNDYSIDICDEAVVEQKTTAMRAAQPAWQQLSVAHRAVVLLRWQQAIIEMRTAFIDALIADTGRYNETQMEFDSVIGSMTRWCASAPELLADPNNIESSIPGLAIGSRAVPYAVVGVISPWNFPLLLSLIDAVPALLCGCSVIIKPSEVTPRFIAPLLASLKNIPELDNIIHCISGDGSSGAALINHVDMVIFTGSVATGKKVGEAAAKRFIPAFLELGGKDAVIVCEDVDIDRVTAAIAWGGLANAGQSCLSVERVYVAEAIYQPFVDRLAERVRGLKLAVDNPQDGQIGPVIAEKQAAILQSHIDDAKAKGAVIECGGMIETTNGGLWCQPTVFSQVNHSMKVMTEESFGPLLPVHSFGDDAEAIALANDSPFGLSAAVFAADQQRAVTIAEAIEAGAVSINDCALTAIMHDGEKQSFKTSGLGGSRMGPASLRRFIRKKALLINTEQQWDPWWFHQNN